MTDYVEFEQLKERCGFMFREIELGTGTASLAKKWVDKYSHAMVWFPGLTEVMFRVEDTTETSIDILFRGHTTSFCVLGRYYRPGGDQKAHSMIGRDGAGIYDHAYNADRRPTWNPQIQPR